MIPHFTSLADAVRASFPPDSCRVVTVEEHGGAGFALFDTRPSSEPYLYEVHYHRQEGLWSEGSSSNGPGWHRIDPKTNLGVVTIWGDAPPGADRVRFDLMGETLEDAVSNDVYVFVRWDMICPATPAEATYFRVAGEWRRA